METVQCSKCGQILQNSKHVEKHIHDEHASTETDRLDEKYYKCDMCELEFDADNALEEHIKHYHGRNIDQKRNVKCENEFDDKASLNKHEKACSSVINMSLCSRTMTSY